MFNGQLEVVKGLQASLNVAYEENKALVKEMEMLNAMFSEMERSHVAEALKDYETTEVDLSDTSHKDDKGKVVAVHEILEAVDADRDAKSNIQESCFKEVTTKNGTKMVLSVSKTFMKLKDLILEKKTLEDQLEKMKNINMNLSSKVNIHEAKLYNITDELNKTWNYVSTLKLQHRKLHTNEQILRAELVEKRLILAQLREELEFSRQNWILVRQKTADSEKEWRALRDEFASRRQMFTVETTVTSPITTTSSESGFSDSNQTEEEADENNNSNNHNSESAVRNRLDSVDEEEEEVPKPTELSEPTPDHGGDGDAPVNPPDTTPNIPLFIPPIDYLTHVPAEMIPPFFDSPQAKEIPENYSEIYSNLIASTERSAELANRLPNVRVMGGCCGTDHRHIECIASH